MTGHMIRKFFWNTFDHLGGSVVLNLLWLLLSAPWLLGAYVLVRLLTRWIGSVGLVTGLITLLIGLWLGSPGLGLLAAASKWADYQNPDRAEIWAAFRNRLWTGLWLSSAAIALTLVLGVNSAFYLQLTGTWKWLGLALAGIMLWAQIALLSIVFHLALQLARDQDTGVREAIRQATFLALMLPVQSIVLGGATLALAIGLCLTSVGLPLAAMAFPSILAATGQRELLKRFRPDESGQEETDRLEEVRTFRDLLKPWDMDR